MHHITSVIVKKCSLFNRKCAISLKKSVEWFSKCIWFIDIMCYAQQSPNYSPPAAIHVWQREYILRKHSWNSLDKTVFIATVAASSILDWPLKRRRLLKTSSQDKLLFHRSSVSICVLFLSVISSKCGRFWYSHSANTIYALNECKQLQFTNMSCLENRALLTYIFVITSHVTCASMP